MGSYPWTQFPAVFWTYSGVPVELTDPTVQNRTRRTVFAGISNCRSTDGDRGKFPPTSESAERWAVVDSASCASLFLSSAFARSNTTVWGIGYLVMLLYPMKCV
jgi:hypothetical protein